MRHWLLALLLCVLPIQMGVVVVWTQGGPTSTPSPTPTSTPTATPPTGTAVIPDETEWTNQGVIFTRGGVGDFDQNIVGGTNSGGQTIKFNGTYFMYYAASIPDEVPPASKDRKIGVATTTTPGVLNSWVKHPDTVLDYIPHPPPNECPDEGIFGMVPIVWDGTIYMYYGAMRDTGGCGNVDSDIRVATSTNGFDFTDQGKVIGDGVGGDPCAGCGTGEIYPIAGFRRASDGKWFIYYVNAVGAQNEVYLTQSTTAGGNNFLIFEKTGTAGLDEEVLPNRGASGETYYGASLALLDSTTLAIFQMQHVQGAAPIRKQDVYTAAVADPYTLSAPVEIYDGPAAPFDKSMFANSFLDGPLWRMFYGGCNAVGGCTNADIDRFEMRTAASGLGPTPTPTPTPTVTPTPPPGGQLFATTCTGTDGVALSGWTYLGDADGQWEYQSNTCTNDFATATGYATARSSAALSYSSQFCSGTATDVGIGVSNTGCSFNVQGGNNHYFVGYSDVAGDYIVRNHSSAHATTGSTKNGAADCACTGTSPNAPYASLGAGDGFGITMTGTGAGTNLTFTIYDFGVSLPSDMQDPAASSPTSWSDASDRICTCSYSELNAGTPLTYIDGIGYCGMETFTNDADVASEPNVDNFACGDI